MSTLSESSVSSAEPTSPTTKPWFVYLVRAANGSLYCGISDDPIRRFATHQSGKGARFFLSSPAHEQARETRHILEVEAIGLAALRRTDEDLVALREALGVSGSHYHGDLDSYIACDLVFHRRLVDAAHNPTLSELYRYFSSIVGAQLRQTLSIIPRRQEVFDLHIELLDAVEQRDPERAKAISRQLINEP